MTDIIKDFVGIFPNAVSEEYCDKVINRFEYLKETRSEGRGKIWTRQEAENGISSLEKENDTYFLGGSGGDDLPLKEEDKFLMSKDMSLLTEFNTALWHYYDKYAEKYGVLVDLSLHKMSSGVRIQKYEPAQGYHVWHCDAGGLHTGRRIIAATLYLNTVEEGGETEFLYQSMRVPPIQGTLALFPTAWTHTHRGNPPFKENKYILTTWLEFME